MQERVAYALFVKGLLLAHIGRLEEAIIVLETVVKSLRDYQGHNFLKLESMAFLTRAEVLRSLGRLAESTAGYEEVVARFSEEEDHEFQNTVRIARIRLHNCLLVQWNDSGEATFLEKVLHAGREAVARGSGWFYLARALVFSGEVDEGLVNLMLALENNEIRWEEVNADMVWSAYRTDPRYLDLERKYSETHPPD